MRYEYELTSARRGELPTELSRPLLRRRSSQRLDAGPRRNSGGDIKPLRRDIEFATISLPSLNLEA